MTAKGVNSPAPTTAEVVGGVYNVSPPVLADGQAAALQVDVNGKLITSGGSGGGGNVNITGVNSNPPALNNPLPVELSDGTQAVGTAGNPLSVNVITGGGSNASVGVTGAAAPASATEIGIVDGTGKLQNVSPTSPLPISAASLPLPTLAATSTKQSDGSQKTQVVDGSGNVVGTTGNALDVNIKTGISNPLPVSVASLPLPALAATSTKQSDGTQKTQVVDGSGNVISSTGNALDVNIKTGISNPLPISGTVVTNADTTIGGTVAPSKEILVAGKTNDGTPQYQPIPEGAGGRSVIVEGVAGGTAVPVSGTVTGNQGTAAANTAGWPITSGGVAETTAAWTSATAQNTVLQLNTAGMSAVVVTIALTGTVVSAILTFEASDTTAFTTAYPITGVKAGTTNTAAASNSPINVIAIAGIANTAIIFNVSAFAAFRVRLSTAITNTGTASIGISASAVPNNAGAGAMTNVSGSVIFAISQVGPTAPADNLASNSIFQTSTSSSFPLSVADAVYGGAFSGTPNAALQGWSKLRTPTVFKTASATASGNTALWTPASGNKFRLMRFMVQITGNSTTASGAVVTVSFQDSASATNIAMDAFVPSASLGTGDDFISPWVDLGNGFLSAAANNVLNINLSSALTGGNVRVTVCGTEE
jgi:hypothetical protein